MRVVEPPNEAEFATIAALLERATGIALRPGKETLVHARLWRRLLDRGYQSFDQYVAALQAGTVDLLDEMIDCLTTNKTSFFREREQLQFFSEQIIDDIGRQSPKPRIWSAGCSTGEEPYTLAMLLQEQAAGRSACRILATDICTDALDTARNAQYLFSDLEQTEPEVVTRYVESVAEEEGHVRFKRELREMISFARLNLMGEWPMSGPFDVILCRNVMIYFGDPVRFWLARRFTQLLRPGGYLLIGHSETLSGVSGLVTVRPTIYRRPW